jgi:hypothetical protein
MAKSNGGIIGALNPTSFGKCTVTSQTSSGTLTTQPGTRLVSALVVAGGGGGGPNIQHLQVEVEQEVLELLVHFQFVEQQHIQLQ